MSKKRKRILIALAVVAFILAVLLLGFSYFLGKQIVAGSTQLVTNKSTENVHEEVWKDYGFHYEAFSQAYTIEKIEITSSFDGHTIPADFISSGSENSDVVVMAHGLGGNRHTNYPIAEMFLENGYSVITYDQRSSGENTAEKTTFGYWEKYDLRDCLKYAKKLNPGGKAGVWGESFGGATAVQAVAEKDIQADVAFLILDCPVSSMKWMVAQELKNMNTGLPVEYMMWCGNIVNQIELGFSYQAAECDETAKNIHIPTLVMNSEADELTPVFMGRDIYKRLKSSKKELWTVSDSKHVGMWLDDNEEYRRRVLGFITD